MYLLLYYLYCLCKSVQRSLVLRLLFFSKADAKVRTLFHILQIFSEVFFIFFLSSSHLSCERKNKEKNCRYRPGFKKIVKQRCSHFESGCKGKNFISYTPNKSEVFFSFFFLKAVFMKQTAPNNKKKGRVPTPFLSECQTIAAPVLESGCKSSGFGNTHQIYKAFFIRNIKTFS